MNFHLPVNQDINTNVPDCNMRNSNRSVTPQKVYDQRQYPSLKQTLVKILGINGREVFVPISKLRSANTMEL